MSKPIIEIPFKLTQKLEKVRLRRATVWKKFFVERNLGISGIIIPWCAATRVFRSFVTLLLTAFLNKYLIETYRHNKRFNHYEGQRYPGQIIPLISRFWKKSKYSDDNFTIVASGKNTSFTENGPFREDVEFLATDFEQFGLNPIVLSAIKDLGFKSPTEIQSRAIPILLKGFNTMLAAETGCGKTLAYVAPLVTSLLQLPPCTSKDIGLPRAVILAPTHELLSQIHEMINQISGTTPLRTHLTKREEFVLELEKNPVDIIVSTPQLLLKNIATGLLDLQRVRNVIVDEADQLLDEDFGESTLQLLHSVKMRIDSITESMSQPGAQLVLASATYPDELSEMFNDLIEMDNLRMIRTDSLHKVQYHVAHKFIRVKSYDTFERLLHLVRKDVRSNNQTLIFVNNVKKCFSVHQFLTDQSVNVKMLHSRLSLNERLETFDLFRNGHLKTLVATDIASKGLDTTHVGHVINVGMPLKVSGYLHRVGRVGRISSLRTGHVTNLVSSQLDMAMVQVIEEAVRLGHSLTNVNQSMGIMEKQFEVEEEQI